MPAGISYSKEFQSLLEYISITNGNMKLPSGSIPSFRPSNLPAKTPEEERLH